MISRSLEFTLTLTVTSDPLRVVAGSPVTKVMVGLLILLADKTSVANRSDCTRVPSLRLPNLAAS